MKHQEVIMKRINFLTALFGIVMALTPLVLGMTGGEQSKGGGNGENSSGTIPFGITKYP